MHHTTNPQNFTTFHGTDTPFEKKLSLKKSLIISFKIVKRQQLTRFLTSMLMSRQEGPEASMGEIFSHNI